MGAPGGFTAEIRWLHSTPLLHISVVVPDQIQMRLVPGASVQAGE